MGAYDVECMKRKITSSMYYSWTRHAEEKLRYYRLSPSRVIRVIRHPERTEVGILEGAVACMQPANTSTSVSRSAGFSPAFGHVGHKDRYSEIWVMYVVQSPLFSERAGFAPAGKTALGDASSFVPHEAGRRAHSDASRLKKWETSLRGKKQIKIITAWRYPGKSPERDPIPADILREIKAILYH